MGVQAATPFEPAATGLPKELLARYAKATREQLEFYLDPPSNAPFLDALLEDYPARGGKMLRPSICIANACQFGGTLESAVRCAAAIELLHNALLIHDDVQDESDMRRGDPRCMRFMAFPWRSMRVTRCCLRRSARSWMQSLHLAVKQRAR